MKKQGTKEMSYLEKIQGWFNKEKPKGGVSIAHIYHDDDCAYWKNGNCNCDAELKIEKLDTQKVGKQTN